MKFLVFQFVSWPCFFSRHVQDFKGRFVVFVFHVGNTFHVAILNTGFAFRTFLTCAFSVVTSNPFCGRIHVLILGLSHLLLHVLGPSRVRLQYTPKATYQKAGLPRLSDQYARAQIHGAVETVLESGSLGVGERPLMVISVFLSGLLKSWKPSEAAKTDSSKSD